MLSTVILDAYTFDRAKEVAEAIDAVCPPEGGGPFGPGGLYAFWDPESRELFYVGIALDLGIRFRQHNGLVSAPPEGCKVDRIRSWFEDHELLGYSIVPMSPLDEASTVRSRRPYRDDMRARRALEDLSEMTNDEVRDTEGKLLQAHIDRHGSLPPWNAIGGSKFGARGATPDTAPMLDFLRARYRHALTAKLQIRELAGDAMAARWENLLHVARYEMLMRHGGGSDELLRAEVERWSQGEDWTGAADFRELLASGYLD